ncbi:MAG: IS110 family transposase [Hydrogenophaga sp.]|uniref:IS110 family transposase n=1 Tax=Hydrogenophaga sp. TaxID=1904254 RepID=UPI00274C6A14|nr:IS110 family transposase [Hydrogenophaga sp.]MDP2416202.1 IS110 family transposase [Hydrogenophaga sp.]MDZ4186614.1 IS110 family transposase [Hydrogenophaga sp.]
MAQRKRPTTQSAISLTHPNAAGIDIGSAAHFVAVPPDRDNQPVREFASFTTDLHRLADWLDACGVDTVAMESTGVYWIPLYELLESRGFTVLLVNARHVKNVSGRKSDVLDCQWLQQLMSFGLLQGAFRPADQVCVLRSLCRQRTMLLRSQGRFVQHMQKALTQMNIQLANVISDVAGETGQKILRAIVDGERDGHALAKLRNARIHASEDEIAKSLQGNWRVEHLFALKQALDAFDFCGTQLAECDTQIQAQLQALHVREDAPAKGKKRGRARNAPKFDLRTQLFQMCGVDLTRIDGIDVTTALVVVSEVGADMGKFPSDKHFASWLGLCPGTKITGGKVMSGKTKRCANRAAQALRLAAAALRSSQSALGAYYRRMCARMDKPKAVTAAAHKLARLIYAMLTHGQEYTDRGQDYFEERYRQRVLHNLTQKAKTMGMQLVPSDNTA